MRRVPPPPVLRSWDIWAREVEASLAARGSWSGRYDLVLGWAAGKLDLASARDRERSAREGWDTPDTYLARWARLRRLDLEVTAGVLVLRVRPRAAGSKKKAPPVDQEGPGLFEGMD